MNVDQNAAVNERLKLLSVFAAVGGAIVLVLVAIFMAVVLILALRVQDAATKVELQAQQSHDSLCAIEAYTVANIRRTTTFLAKNPDGLRKEDGDIVIPASIIEEGLAEDREFLDALRENLFCGSED